MWNSVYEDPRNIYVACVSRLRLWLFSTLIGVGHPLLLKVFKRATLLFCALCATNAAACRASRHPQMSTLFRDTTLMDCGWRPHISLHLFLFREIEPCVPLPLIPVQSLCSPLCRWLSRVPVSAHSTSHLVPSVAYAAGPAARRFRNQ